MGLFIGQKPTENVEVRGMLFQAPDTADLEGLTKISETTATIMIGVIPAVGDLLLGYTGRAETRAHQALARAAKKQGATSAVVQTVAYGGVTGPTFNGLQTLPACMVTADFYRIPASQGSES